MARECGIKYNKNGFCVTGQFEIWHEREWTIERAECREVIREKFKVSTTWDNLHEVYLCFCSKLLDTYYGETIAEAEISCIIEICKNVCK